MGTHEVHLYSFFAVDRLCSFVCSALSFVTDYDDSAFYASDQAELLIKQCQVRILFFVVQCASVSSSGISEKQKVWSCVVFLLYYCLETVITTVCCVLQLGVDSVICGDVYVSVGRTTFLHHLFSVLIHADIVLERE